MPSVEVSHELNFNTQLSNEIKEIAIKNGECEETKEQTIEAFRQYILEQNECQPNRMDDAFLQKFLRARFWKIETSHRLLCNYYKFRERNKSYYEKVRPFDLRYIGDDDVLTATPYRDQHGRRILIYRFGVWKTNKITVDDIFRASIALIELGSLEHVTQVVGGIAIFDLQDLTLNHVLHLSPSVAQKMIALLVTSMPVRTAALHVVFQNWAFSAAYKIFKPFLSAAMKENLFIHGSDMKSLHKYINPESLPKRYGGVHDDYPYMLWFEHLPKYKNIQREMESLGYVFDEP